MSHRTSCEKLVAAKEAAAPQRPYSSDGNGGRREGDEPMPTAAAPTLQLLAWIAERSRTYPETIEVWKSSCPLDRLGDAVSDGLVRVERGQVLLTASGSELLAKLPS